MTDNPILPTNDVPVTPDDSEEQPKGAQIPAGENTSTPENAGPADLGPRLERLGGEPAPDITPEEFARLQQAGQIHIDPRGRVRATQREEASPGISLRKRRAWYSFQ